MSRYILSRIGQALFVLWVAFTASYLLLQALPGDAILIKFQNPELGLGPEQIAALREAYGVDSPLWQQYLQALGNFLTGQFGYSVVGSVPVAHELLSNLPGHRPARDLRLPPRRHRRLRAGLPRDARAVQAGCAPPSRRSPPSSSRCRCSGSASC